MDKNVVEKLIALYNDLAIAEIEDDRLYDIAFNTNNEYAELVWDQHYNTVTFPLFTQIQEMLMDICKCSRSTANKMIRSDNFKCLISKYVG